MARRALLANLGAAEPRLGNSGNSLDHLRFSRQEMEATVGPAPECLRTPQCPPQAGNPKGSPVR